MNKKLMLILFGMMMMVLFNISIIVRDYNSLTDQSLHTLVKTQENYALTTAKFAIQLANFKNLILSNSKNLDEIRLSLDILFMKALVLKTKSESTVLLYKEEGYEETINVIYQMLENIDVLIQEEKPDMNKVHVLVNDIESKSRFLVNVADHARAKQKEINIIYFDEKKNEIRSLLYFSGLLITLLFNLIFFFICRLNNLLKLEKKTLRNKNAFLGIVSHELKSSLQAIVSTIELISNDKNNPPQFQRLESAVSKMETQMKDLSDFSKIDNGRIKINEVQFNLKKIIECTLDECALRVKNNNVLIAKGKISDINIISDPIRIMQIAENLVTNALKYTETGSVNVSAICDSKKNIVLKVEDTGCGIPEDKMDDIFRPFEQVKVTDSKTPGFGMGLAIVKGLVKAMNGHIFVKSEVGKGSCFSVIIPITLGTIADELDTVDNYIYESHFAQLKILLVDDNEILCKSLESTLKIENYNIEFTTSSVRALEKLLRKPYDLVISDIKMPIITGDELYLKVRSSTSPNIGVPFIFISADTDISPIESIPMLTKPIRTRDINRTINELISR